LKLFSAFKGLKSFFVKETSYLTILPIREIAAVREQSADLSSALSSALLWRKGSEISLILPT